MTRLTRCVAIAAAAVALAFGGAAQAYPDKPVRYIVAYPAGGVSDLLARTLADAISKRIGQQIVVDNRPGASGMIAAEAAAEAAPDGYTVFQGESSTQVLNKLLREAIPYDPVEDFEPVTLLAESPMVLLVRPDSPAQTLQEFIELAEAKRGELDYGSGGNATTMHLTTERFLQGAGIDAVHLAYKGTPRVLQDLLAGEIDFALPNVPPSLPHIEGGTLRALAVTSGERLGNLPDIPTIAEAVPGFKAVNWYGLYVPTGTPKEIVEKLNAEVQDALNDEALKTQLVEQGFIIRTSSPGELTAYAANESEKWQQVLKEAGIGKAE